MKDFVSRNRKHRGSEVKSPPNSIKFFDGQHAMNSCTLHEFIMSCLSTLFQISVLRHRDKENRHFENRTFDMSFQIFQ